MIKVALEAPWETFVKEVRALFENDGDIAVSDIYEPEDGSADYGVAIQVKSHEKYMALDRLMTKIRTFGGVTLGVELYDEENQGADVAGLFKTLFEGNPIVDSVRTRTDPAGGEWSYVLFAPEIVQFFDDDLTDYNGNWTGLAEDIARDVFDGNDRGVYFCTAAKQ